MSTSNAMPIPLLNPGITIAPYEEMSAGTPTRYLLSLGDSYFLVSAKARALVAALLRGPATVEQLEKDYAAESGQELSAATLLALAEKTLPPLLFIDAPTPPRKLPFIVSLTVLGPRLAARVTGCLAWLFDPRLAICLIALFVPVHLAVLPDAMQLAHAASSARDAIALAALFMLSSLVHELGHTSACRYYGCPHGGIGVGLYFIFPAWFADVTKAWQLQRRQRAVVDLGGVYFQSIFLIALDAYALATGSPLAHKLAWLITFAMLFTLNPVFKFDGYWLLSDLSGLHNLHKQVRTSAASLITSLMGRRAAAAPAANSTILYAYAVLSAGYFVYFGLFLTQELISLASSLTPTTSAAWTALMAANGGWETAAAAGHLAAALVWPAIVISGAAFFVNKLRRAIAGIAITIREASALPARGKPA